MSRRFTLVALGSALSLFACGGAWAQCDATCPVGGIPQNDGCGEEVTDPNGGCNFTPELYQDVGAVSFGNPISVCGTVGTFGAANRDLDWYTFTLAVPSKVQVSAFHADGGGFAVSNFTIFIVQGTDCDTQTTLFAAASGACPFNSDEVILPAGTHVAIFTVNAFAPAEPICPVTYAATITVTAEGVDCPKGGGPCFTENAEPGCDNKSCCLSVCTIETLCCSNAWDAGCVFLACSECGICEYICDNPGVANDCATAALSLAANGGSSALDNTNANTDGPPNDNACDYGKDVWFITQFDQAGGGELQIDVTSAGWDSTIALYALGASPIFSPQDLSQLFIGCVDVLGAGGETAVLIDAVEGEWYLIQIAGFQSQFGAGQIDLSSRRVIFNTGNTRPVLFDAANGGNYTNTNLGFSSGNLNAANAQRWFLMPFKVSDPGPGLIWRITAIHAYGFTPAGTVNQTLDYKIWHRTSLLTVPTGADVPVAEGGVPFPAPTDIVGGAANEDHEIAVDFTLEPGDYWLTVYGASGAGLANFAWFSNPTDSIAIIGPQGAQGWRSALFPVPGFVIYKPPATTLAAPPEQTDPERIYTVGGRILGTKDACPGGDCGPTCKIGGDRNGDGCVNGGDITTVLGLWDPTGDLGNGLGQGDANCDGVVGGADITMILGEWLTGPNCP